MSANERDYFEQLVALRLRPMGDDDRRSVISIADVVIRAEAALLATELELEAGAAEVVTGLIPSEANVAGSSEHGQLGPGLGRTSAG